MDQNSKLLKTARGVATAYNRAIRALVLILAAVAGLGILTMMTVTCLDVVMRAFGSPLKGALDIVKISGAITIACGLPYTTAVKGHVAIEYFFHKLSRRGRIVVDTLARSACMALFAFLSWQCLRYGMSLKKNGVVTDTLGLPEFWIPYVIAFCCGVVVLVILHNMLHPGKEMIKA